MMKKFKWSLPVLLVAGLAHVYAQDSHTVANDTGKALYEQHCLACHQADGSGVPNLAPPLIKGDFVAGEKKKLVEIVLNGLQGVEIKGENYANPMPAFDYLSDEDIANVLTYVRSNFTNDATPITAEEVKKIRRGK